MARSLRWSERRLGDERTLERRIEGATFLFALGPPSRGFDPGRRVAAVERHLGCRVHSVHWLRQVHGTGLVDVTGTDVGGCAGTGDGLLTSDSRRGILVWTADCVPLLLAFPRGIAAVHAGWRGAAEGIVGRAVERLCPVGSDRDRGHAVLGPAISGSRYEVGPEVVEALSGQPVDPVRWQLGPHHVDLRGFVAAQLEVLGIPPERIEMIPRCTASDPTLASFRRDGDRAGRQWSMVFRR